MLPQPIDIVAMKKQQQALMNQKIAFKEINKEELFNMLQVNYDFLFRLTYLSQCK